MWETVPLVLKCLPYHNFKKEWKSSCNKKNEKQVNKTLMSAIMFSTNAMKQQTDKLVLENIYSKTHKFTVKSNSRNTDCMDRGSVPTS